MSLWGPLLAYDDLIEQAEEANIAKSLSTLQSAIQSLQDTNCEAIALRYLLSILDRL